jgi:alkanesulfonate monooxygenase SsuD/methylene tetrahydromethanopterin reductase-like flavin-dependent oxidoreductase (luciferase family)
MADQLGFSEAYVGAHTSSGSERVTSPLTFLATLLQSTSRIRLGTGVINLPQQHPATVAADVAMFDHLSGGRLILGMGPGNLASDVELFDLKQPEQRAGMLLEGIDVMLALWRQDPPYDIQGKYWKFSIKDAIWPEFRVGWLPRPLQNRLLRHAADDRSRLGPAGAVAALDDPACDRGDAAFRQAYVADGGGKT